MWFLLLQYADPVADLLDKWGVFQARLFRDSCVFHHGSYVKVGQSFQSIRLYESVVLTFQKHSLSAFYFHLAFSVAP